MIGTGLSLTQIAVNQLVGRTPATLFSAGEQGAWYDPSDLRTMFQDSGGATPVTAVEQPVGRILDKSGRGNHATQTTSTSRPVLSARVNLLTATATLATQTVVTRATTQTLRFTGSGTVTLSGTATGTFSAGTHSVTTTAGNLTLTVSGTVTEADLRASNMGVGLPAYQAVVNSTTYDTAGFPLYLRFDGVDDFLVTNSINFTGNDAVTVFAGARNLGTTANGTLVENFAGGASFRIAAPRFGNDYGFSVVATLASSAASSATYPAPNTAVLTGIGQVSTDTCVLRVNGAQAASSTADQGTGTYGNNPLYIGRRQGTSLPFNGHLYSLIVRGAQSNAGQIGNTEQWVAGKTGITL